MNNTQRKYMARPWTINIMWKKTIRVLKRWEKKFNTKKFIQIIGLCILAVILLLMINKTEATEDIKSKEDTVQAKEVKEVVETQKTTIKWNNRVYAVQVWGDRIETMRNMWLSETRILDLLAIMNMECGSYKWDCIWYARDKKGRLIYPLRAIDIWPMQINKVHKEEFRHSKYLYENEKWGELFIYQLKYANQLVQSYEDRFCGKHIFDLIWKEYSNQRRWNCVGKSYNWHPRYKFAYMQLGWERREVIKSLMWY